MLKPILSQSDIDSLIAKFYSLPDSLLVAEADKVAADFRTWLNSEFDLTTEQIAYVDTYPEIVNRFYGYLFASAFLTRGPITFPAIPNNPAPRRIKETRANLFGDVTFNDQAKSLDGTLDVTIEFTLL
ncbi:MAG: hypothetical protein JNM21_14885 [Taibaiella sp.]|nr:hypothetical protein [Taibaiella sp.]